MVNVMTVDFVYNYHAGDLSSSRASSLLAGQLATTRVVRTIMPIYYSATEVVNQIFVSHNFWGAKTVCMIINLYLYHYPEVSGLADLSRARICSFN